MIETTPYNVFKTIFVYSAFILLAPITSFFMAKFFLMEGILGASSVTSNVWSAVVAVIVLHIALGLFIYRAYFDSGKAKPEEKVD